MKKALILSFLGIFAIKLICALAINNLVIYPDESCFLIKAQHFANTGKIESCENITGQISGNPAPLFSILISPIYKFTSGQNAFHILLSIQALLISSLIFPLFYIFKRCLKKEKLAIIFSIITVFLPSIVSYEKSAMSESIFLITNIYFLYFYLKSFETKISKIPAIILGILASLLRPYGFIVLISMLINELIIQKNKKRNLIILIIGSILASILVKFLLPHLFTDLSIKIASLKEGSNWLYLLKALKNQVNSLIIATFLIPLILFFNYFKEIKNKNFKKIRFFILSFLILNFIISAQHIYFYYINYKNLDLLIRYLNVSSIFLIISSFIILSNIKTLKLKSVLFTIIVLPLFALEYSQINHSLNMSLSPFYTEYAGFLNKELFFKIILLPLIFFLLILTIFEKKKLLLISLSTVLLLQSLTINTWQISNLHAGFNKEIINEFKNKNTKILSLEHNEFYKNHPRYLNLDYWQLRTFTNNDITVKKVFSNTKQEDLEKLLKENDYLLTTESFENYQKIYSTQYGLNIYKL